MKSWCLDICLVLFVFFFSFITSVRCLISTLLIWSHPTEQRCRPYSSGSPSEWFVRSDHSIQSFLFAFTEHLAGDPQPTNCNLFPKNISVKGQLFFEWWHVCSITYIINNRLYLRQSTFCILQASYILAHPIHPNPALPPLSTSHHPVCFPPQLGLTSSWRHAWASSSAPNLICSQLQTCMLLCRGDFKPLLVWKEQPEI